MRNLTPRLFTLALLAFIGAACTTKRAMPERDFDQPEWRVLNGQALWKAQGDRPLIAGDILLAQHDNGDVYVSFAKGPVVVFTAQTHGNHWQLDLLQNNKTYGGRGRPPQRFVWFYLPALILDDNTLGNSWRVDKAGPGEWLIESEKSHESIRLFLDP